jgi:hypothetical protein
VRLSLSLALHAICKEKNSRVSDPPGKPKNVGNDHQNPPAQFLQRYLIKKNLTPTCLFQLHTKSNLLFHTRVNKEWRHTMALPFTLKSILRQKKKYNGNSKYFTMQKL